MYKLTKISAAIAAVGLSGVLFMGHSNADTDDMGNDFADDIMQTIIADTSIPIAEDESYNQNEVAAYNEENIVNENEIDSQNETGTAIIDTSNSEDTTDVSPVTNEVSQKLSDSSKTVISSNKFLPNIKYNTDNLSKTAKKVNAANWTTGVKIDRDMGTKIQALLNWNQSGVGAVDGYWGKNTLKAMQAFQKSRGLTITDALNDETWKALTNNSKLSKQPVLVNYQLTDADINVNTTTIPAGATEKSKLEGMYYESVLEGLAEKFHMGESYLKSLNPNASFSAGEIITVYNPGNPNNKPVTRVIADKTTQTLYAYDDKDNLIASYPTTVGSMATPSPTGTHTVNVKVHEPNYTYTHEDGHKSILPPGPNNPVGSVWIGLSKPSYGIHGSPDPARISRQASAGCVRLTNWDALALLGVIQNGATVEFQ